MQPATPRGRGARKLSAAVAGLAIACTAATQASGSGGGGVATGDPPKLTGVVCLEQCAGVRTAAVGSVIRLDGSDLEGVDAVRLAGNGARVEVNPRKVRAGSVEAKVPEGAVSGTVKVKAYGSQAETPRNQPLEVVAKDQIPAAGDFKLTSAEATPRTTFYDGVAAPTVTYLFQGGAATDVRIEVIDRDTREVVRTWVDEDAQPSTRNSARWNGRTDDGALAANGEYKFRIGSASGGGLETTANSRFGYYKFRFPTHRQARLRRRLRCRPGPPGPGRVREVRRDAARRARRPGAVEQDPQRGRQLPGHRRQGDTDGLHVRPPQASLGAAAR